MSDFKFGTEPTPEGGFYVTRKMIAITVNRDIRELAQLDQAVADLRMLANWLEDQREALKKALQE